MLAGHADSMPPVACVRGYRARHHRERHCDRNLGDVHPPGGADARSARALICNKPFHHHSYCRALTVLLIASFFAVAGAKSFLETKVGASSIERALLSELSGKADKGQLLKIR